MGLEGKCLATAGFELPASDMRKYILSELRVLESQHSSD